MVSHPNTIRYQRCLTWVFERKLVFSRWHGSWLFDKTDVLVLLGAIWACSNCFLSLKYNFEGNYEDHFSTFCSVPLNSFQSFQPPKCKISINSNITLLHKTVHVFFSFGFAKFPRNSGTGKLIIHGFLLPSWGSTPQLMDEKDLFF